jgi:phosphatidate phosphatase PAH1
MKTDPDENEPFRVQAADGVFRVIDAAGEVVLACGDEANAGQYAALLSQAYRQGYKAGYRNARSSS